MKKRLLLLLAIGGLIALVVKSSARRRDEWHGLSEADIRAKLDSRIPSRVPEDKRAVIADKVVTKMRERGVITDDEAESELAGVTGSPSSAGGESGTTTDAPSDASIDLRDGQEAPARS